MAKREMSRDVRAALAEWLLQECGCVSGTREVASLLRDGGASILGVYEHRKRWPTKARDKQVRAVMAALTMKGGTNGEA